VKIHLKQIPTDGLHLEGDEECPMREIEADEMRCAGPLHYRLDVGVADGALWANGSLTQPVELRCVACLEKFHYVIRVPAFALHIQLPGPEMIDLTPFLREDILLNLPAHPHCDRDGGRVCNAAHLQTGEPEATRKADWSALDKLKLKR
jgi:DUF177 domain-containing protein